MVIIDKILEELEKRDKPIRVGLIGAGFAGRGFANQLLSGVAGMRLSAISNRTLENAETAYKQSGVKKIKKVKNQKELSEAIKNGISAITDDPILLCQNKTIDVIVEATGEVEFGSKVILEAIKNKKHVCLINAELDGTLGPILKQYADRYGVVYTQADGDQPAVMMNLFREVKLMGFKPVMVGNIKSLLDHYRTPLTQLNWAKEHFQKPKMVTSFADGTKISFENATIANATGFKVGKRGMFGPKTEFVMEAVNLFPLKKYLKQGLVDYILGAEPSFGIFVIGYSKNKVLQKYMSVYKMGEGPFYLFYRPFHLSPIEAPKSVARAYLFKDSTLSPLGKSFCDVITVAKIGLKKGEILDGIGGFTCYGVIENTNIVLKERLLPMGLSDGCILKKEITKDQVVTYQDVLLPKNRLSDKLRKEQDKLK